LHRAAWVAAERLRILAPSHGLGPDGKVIVVGEAAGHATGIQRISLSLQHHTHADRAQLWHAAIDVAATVGITDRERITVNGGGDFDVGGPHGDNGLSGKKLVCDAYGPTVPIGGGAWSGKDPHKVDRVGGLRARQLALRAVRRGLGEKATATIGWFPGDRSPSLVRVVADGNPVPLAALGPLALDIATTARAFAGVRWAERVGRWFQEEGPWEAP
jgi:S-adenosylmethionine synthetase